jgi:FtsP/CotA-like multicopper oxidase with cupredoxin domain
MNVKVPLRFQPGQYSGYTVSHCHFLPHEDVGCMKGGQDPEEVPRG